MYREEYGGININYNDKQFIEAHIAQLVIFVDNYKNGKEIYYVKESSLYALGDRNLAVNPGSNRLLVVSMDYLDNLIKSYESNNPSIVIEKVNRPIDEYISIEAGNIIRDDLIRFIEDNKNKVSSKEELNKIINNVVDKYDLDSLKKELYNSIVDKGEDINNKEGDGKKM